jgi:hypothetical protein
LKNIEWVETGNWKFINQKIIDILPMLSKEEQYEFDCDPRNIDWKLFIRDYCMGLQIYVAEQDTPEYKHGFTQILNLNKDMYDDVKESFKKKEGLKPRDYIDGKRIIDDNRYSSYMKIILSEMNENGKMNENQIDLLTKANYRYDEKKIADEVRRMSRCITVKPIQGLFYIFHKILRKLISGLFVDLDALEKIKMMSQ